MRRVHSWLVPVAALAALALLAYSSSFRGGFNFDDFTSIRDNPLVRTLDSYFASSAAYRSEPNRWVGNLTFALNYRLGGFDTTGYHAVNFCIHLLNTLLVFALVVGAFRTPRLRGSALAPAAASVAFAAAGLFATHPLQTQAVTYIVQRLASLATLFYLLAVVVYLRWRLAQEAGRWGRARSIAAYVGVLLSAALAMKTKEIAFTLPAAVVGVELGLFGKPSRRTLWLLAPIVATALIIPLTILASRGEGRPLLEDVLEATRVRSLLSRGDYLTTEIAVVAAYLGLLVFPAGQNLDHDFPIQHTLLAPRVLLSLSVLGAIVALAIFLWRHRSLDPAAKLVSLGVAWFFLALSVESSFVPIVDVMYEHRVYLPSVGFFVAVAAGGAFVCLRLSPAAAGRNTAAIALLLAAALAAVTFERNRVWTNEVTLWTDVAQKSPDKGRARMNLALALARHGEPERALGEYEAAIRADPDLAEAHNNLGVLYFKLGRVDAAISRFRRAIEILPSYPEAHNNLGVAYGRKGERELAAAEIAAGLRLRAVFGAH